MNDVSRSSSLTIRLPKRGRSSGSLTVACVLGRYASINEFEVDLLDAILREQGGAQKQLSTASNDNLRVEGAQPEPPRLDSAGSEAAMS